MPRYFFHVEDGHSLPDAEGTELTSPDEARSEAIRLAGAILRDEDGDALGGRGAWRLVVADESGLLFTLNVSVTEAH